MERSLSAQHAEHGTLTEGCAVRPCRPYVGCWMLERHLGWAVSHEVETARIEFEKKNSVNV